MYYKYYNLLQKYNKLEQLDVDFSSLEFLENTYCISLSGGVDSMVLMDILYRKNKNIIAIHLNYNNREESDYEEEFLKEYCNTRNINFISYKFDFQRTEINRSIYEIKTRKIRFELYNSILQKYNLDKILIGHHKDDIIENIYTNFCKGENFLNLGAIKYQSIIQNVNIIRPLIDYYKR